jgi:hypothetical protein
MKLGLGLPHHFQRLGIEVPDALGNYKVPHFDAKAEANASFTALGVPTTFLQTPAPSNTTWAKCL